MARGVKVHIWCYLGFMVQPLVSVIAQSNDISRVEGEKIN